MKILMGVPPVGCLEEGLEGELAIYQAGRRKMFKYDRVFGMESTQEAVYEDTKALIRSVLDGTLLLPFESKHKVFAEYRKDSRRKSCMNCMHFYS